MHQKKNVNIPMPELNHIFFLLMPVDSVAVVILTNILIGLKR